MQSGDILTHQEVDYVEKLEKLWGMLSDAIEGGRLSPADIPDDYDAFVMQMVSCNMALELTPEENADPVKTLTIPMYRIVPSNAGIGWVCVEKWNGNMYTHLATCRTRHEAGTFIENE